MVLPPETVYGGDDRKDILLEPDTFWELIEKVLLCSSRDEHQRVRDNTSLSALCRGHALPRLPHKQKTRKLKRSTFEVEVKNHTASKEHIDAKSIKIPINEALDKQRGKPASVEDIFANAKETKSECCVNDLDVVFVKNTDVPESERLWRYAIKNRKQKQSECKSENGAMKPIPNVRSNEAIYKGLQQRMEDIVPEKKQQKSTVNNERIVRKHSCSQLTNGDSHSKDIQDNRASDRKLSQNTATKQDFASHLSLPSVPLNRSKSEIFKRDSKINQSAWIFFNDIDGFRLNQAAKSTAKVDFEKSKSLYDSTIKKRLYCGNQLETLNKAIISKKTNPRSLLSRKTKKRYTELKNEYLNLCYQESSLRHQIAMLHAEIYMMQNKSYHKLPASIKTITFDSTSALNNSRSEVSCINNRHAQEHGVPLFPHLKAPRPFIPTQQRGLPFDKYCDHQEKKRAIERSDILAGKSTSLYDGNCYLPNVSEGAPPHGVCSVYSFTPQMMPPPKRQTVSLMEPMIAAQEDKSCAKLTHRLPRMTCARDMKT